jgi:hypothetical protein
MTAPIPKPVPREPRPRLTVVVEQVEGPPIDLEAWSRLYVATLMRLDAEDHGEPRQVRVG